MIDRLRKVSYKRKERTKLTLTQSKQGMTAPDGATGDVDTFDTVRADGKIERPRFDPDPDALAPVNMDTVPEQTLIELLYRYFYGAATSDGLISSDRQLLSDGFVPSGGLVLSNRQVSSDVLVPSDGIVLSNRQVPSDGLVPSFLGFAISLGIRLCDIRRMYLKSAAFAEAVRECECIRREMIAKRVLDGSIPVNQAKFLLDDDVIGYSERYLAGEAAADIKGSATDPDGGCGEGFRLIVHFDDPALQRAGKEGGGLQ